MRWENIAPFQLEPRTEPALWVGDSMANGLEQAGFRVIAVGNVTDSKTPVALDIAITELGITYAGKPPLIGIPYCTGDLTIKVTIFDHGQQTFEGSYTGDDERQCWNLVPDTMSAILDVLMQKMLERALPDLSAQLLKAGETERTAAAFGQLR